jgi:hypothetical protein|tara:strand:- start:319 stop:492 length:174 start_codon:yes stop_codon:yes gene_type:complete
MRKICEACMGNGYRRIWKDQHEKEKITIQCAECDSAGEVEDADFNYDYSGVDVDKLQ